MSTAAPITAVVTTETSEFADLADTYARMVDELAAILEQSGATDHKIGRIAASWLGSLHTDLDEFTATLPARQDVVDMVNDIQALRRYLRRFSATHPSFRACETPLAELREVLVDAIAVARFAEASA